MSVRARAGLILSCLALGVIGGAVGASLVLGHRIEQLTLRHAAAVQRADRLETEIAGLQKSLSAHQTRPIKRVEVHVIDVDDERARLQIEEDVYDLFEHFIGDDMNRLDPTTVRRLVERTLIIDKSRFNVRVWGVFAAQSSLQLYVTATPTRA